MMALTIRSAGAQIEMLSCTRFARYLACMHVDGAGPAVQFAPIGRRLKDWRADPREPRPPARCAYRSPR